MVWAGSPFAQRIEFTTGTPVGNIGYQLLGNNGEVLLDLTVTPAVGAVSHLLVIPGTSNTCVLPVFEARTLVWSYTTATGLVSDRVSYRVERPLPLPATAEGVRRKLGLRAEELADERIELVRAYYEFTSLVPTAALTAAATSGDYTALLAVDAVEATAALNLMAALQLELAQRENSGTNEFVRFSSIDWDQIELSLLIHIARARAALDTSFDGNGAGRFTFGTAPRSPDGITGAEA